MGCLGYAPVQIVLVVRHAYAASDVELHHLEKFKKLRFESITIAAEGPLRAALKAEVKYGQSTINVMVSTLVIAEFTVRLIFSL